MNFECGRLLLTILVQYEPGEYYKTHTDYNPGHVPLQTGVRTLTFFLYLNTVERGGGTNFPQLNLTVTPVQGKAVLWPSVLNEDPNALDNRTLHQSLTVEQGTKYGANVWIHQRTYRGETYYRGCTYA
jgi:prolyl 4-hydroxylase